MTILRGLLLLLGLVLFTAGFAAMGFGIYAFGSMPDVEYSLPTALAGGIGCLVGLVILDRFGALGG
jgi:hypothetical protein